MSYFPSGTHEDLLFNELVMRIERLLATVADNGVPNNRFNKRLAYEFPWGRIHIRGKRRGDVYVDIWNRRSQVIRTVFSNAVDREKVFETRLIEGWVLPELRKLMVLDDIAAT
jgi:hypothetical protein